MSPYRTVCTASGGGSRDPHRGSTAGAACTRIPFRFTPCTLRCAPPDSLCSTARSFCSRQILAVFRSVRLACMEGNLSLEIARLGAKNSGAHGLDNRTLFPARHRSDSRSEVRLGLMPEMRSAIGAQFELPFSRWIRIEPLLGLALGASGGLLESQTE